MKTLQQIIDGGKRIVFFGGAGVSTESGIPDFRSADGLYSQKYKYPPEEIISAPFFALHTKEFFDFYREKMLYLDAKPNAAHRKLFELEQAGKLTGIVTQNIDGLHRMAGNRLVFEIHGSVHRNYCVECGREYDAQFIKNSTGIPRCTECGSCVKPDVVLYGESLPAPVVNGALRVISQADVLIIAGTSLTVYPAASFIDSFHGREIVLINRDETPADGRATLVLHEKVAEVMAGIRV